MKFLVLLFATLFFVDQRIAAIQFDVVGSGAFTIEAGIDKQVTTSPLQGRTRVIVYGMNQVEFQGRFLNLSGNVQSVSNVVACDKDAREVAVNLTWLGSPDNLRIN